MRAVNLVVRLFLSAVAVLTLTTVAHYPGHWLVYLLFAVISNALLIRGFQGGAIYFDTFIGIFVWLGFWLKFSVRMTFAGGLFHEAVGAFDGSAAAFDHALIVSSCGIAALLVASLVRKRYFTYPDMPPSCTRSGMFQFYKAHRKLLVGAFLLIVVLVTASNAALGIYQRGMVTQTILPFGMNGIYKWLLQFGLASVSALIIRFEIELNRDLSLISVFPVLLESFFSNVSLLSRGMVLNASALAIGGFRLIRGMKLRLSVLIGSFAVVAFVGLFALSVLSVHYLRANSLGPKAFVTAQRMTTPLIIDRWVGIEGVMAVSSSEKLGWDLWREAWREKYEEGRLGMFDRIFIDSPYQHWSIDRSKHHFVTLPGFVAFFYYPGSLTFLFASLFVLSLMAALIEVATYRLGGRNWVLCSLFAQVIAFRYVSFGYVPAQSYLLFGSLVLNTLIIFAADRLLTVHYVGRRQLA
jgi:hypothetical protein